MIEKVNPSHPDKIADRIGGAIVDLAYKNYFESHADGNPKVAVEVMIGPRLDAGGDKYPCCCIFNQTDTPLLSSDVSMVVWRIAGENVAVEYHETTQDEHLADNQKDRVRCGDNGIFKALPLSKEEIGLSKMARWIYSKFPTDGKYILDGKRLIICQSIASDEQLKEFLADPNTKKLLSLAGVKEVITNPLGPWSGGVVVDTGAINRKLGSDMGHSVTGGGLWGKDCSKADVTLNLYARLKADQTHKAVNLCCAIGDEMVDGRDYGEIVKEAQEFILDKMGGFESLAEWGLF